MNILLLGSGGREHALAWKLKQSPLCKALHIAPGNGGTAALGIQASFGPNDFETIAAYCRHHHIDMVVVGPEEPLVNGIYDYLTPLGIPVIGPSKAAAQLEGSKAFSKKFMQRHGIPTAAYSEFTAGELEAGKAYIAAHSLPVVLKADGLAAGKGVVICPTHQEALACFENMLVHHQFGAAGQKVVIEQFLQGIELSVFVLTDGKDYRIIGHAKDYKRIGEGDTGPNTGGMGCVSPVPFADSSFMQKVEERIIRPTIQGLQAEGLVYEGFVFFGLMNVNGEPYVIEYNCRMGDPETEVVMPRLENDLVELLSALKQGRLNEVAVHFSPLAAATVMTVSGGYPCDYEKGKAMTLPATLPEGTLLFHAGTRLNADGFMETAGGRVAAATALAPTLTEAAQKATALAGMIAFDGAFFRKDIGYEFRP